MASADDILLVFTNLPDTASARALAEALVSERFAACVNVLAPCQSVYRWKNMLESAEEVPVLAKTTRAGYRALEAAIRAHHPYDLPEIIAVPLAAGLPEYLAWVASETGNPDSS